MTSFPKVRNQKSTCEESESKSLFFVFDVTKIENRQNTGLRIRVPRNRCDAHREFIPECISFKSKKTIRYSISENVR